MIVNVVVRPRQLHGFHTVPKVQIEGAQYQIPTDCVVDIEAAFYAPFNRRRFKQFEFQVVVSHSRLVGASAHKGLLKGFAAVVILDVIALAARGISQVLDILVRLTPAESIKKLK